jgi:hypothetical protein
MEDNNPDTLASALWIVQRYMHNLQTCSVVLASPSSSRVFESSEVELEHVEKPFKQRSDPNSNLSIAGSDSRCTTDNRSDHRLTKSFIWLLKKLERRLPLAARLQVFGRNDEEFLNQWKSAKRRWFVRDSIEERTHRS